MTDQQTPEPKGTVPFSPLRDENRDSPPTAAAEPAGMTPEQLAEAKRYGRVELICGLADKALDLVFLSVVAVVAARPDWLQHAPWLRIPTGRCGCWPCFSSSPGGISASLSRSRSTRATWSKSASR